MTALGIAGLVVLLILGLVVLFRQDPEEVEIHLPGITLRSKGQRRRPTARGAHRRSR